MPSNAVSFVFFVTETEYAKLQALCPADFPFTYPQFVTRVNEGIEQMAGTVTVKKAYASIEEFRAWCAQSDIQPDNKARARYAIHLGHE